MCSEELFSHFQKYEIYRDQNIDILPGILSRQYKELSGADAVGLSLTKVRNLFLFSSKPFIIVL